MLFGKEIIHLSDVESTNNFAAKLFSDKLCQKGSVIMSDCQTNGKGQRGTIWQSENGKNLLLLYESLNPTNLSCSFCSIYLTTTSKIRFLATIKYSSIISLGCLFLKSSGFIALLFEQLVIKNIETINKIDLIIFM